MKELVIRNRQRVRRISTALLRRIIRDLLENPFCVENYELCIHLVGAEEMAGVNKQFLDHEGSTDVITFNHHDSPADSAGLHGELFVCLNDAVAQARQFGTSWQSELVRYMIHGLLHLRGYDDLRPNARRLMKREENRVLRECNRRHAVSKLQRTVSTGVSRSKKGR